jgi:hypothetical protein
VAGGYCNIDAPTMGKPQVNNSQKKRLTLAAMSLGYGVVQLDVTIVNSALSSIGSSLGGGVPELQLLSANPKCR